MISPIPIQSRQRRYKARQVPATAAGTVPNLLSGVLAGGISLTLVFDQAMGVNAFSPSAITLSVPGTGTLVATGTPTISGASVLLNVIPPGGMRGRAPMLRPTLTATGSSGLVAAAGGDAWAGVSAFAITTE
jgi:hypothetical protein